MSATAKKLESFDENDTLPHIMAPVDNKKVKEVMIGGELTLVPTGISEEQIPQFLSLSPVRRKRILEAVPEHQASFLRIQQRSQQESEIEAAAKEVAREVHEVIVESASKTQEQLRFPFAPFPTDLTRTSPFFPMSTKERKNREDLKDMEIAHHSWGRITYTGPKLSVTEEDALILLLAFLNSATNRTETEMQGRRTYLYRGSILPLLRLKGIQRPGKNHYEDLLQSFRLLGRANFELTTNKKNESTGKSTPKTSIIAGILNAVTFDPDSGQLIVAINPFFAETFATGNVTLLDVATRLNLDSQVSKCLYRFMQSHRDNKWAGHFMILAAALNLDLNQPTFKLRSIVKKAIAELVHEGTLDASSMIKKDLVVLEKMVKKLPSKKPPAV